MFNIDHGTIHKYYTYRYYAYSFYFKKSAPVKCARILTLISRIIIQAAKDVLKK